MSESIAATDHEQIRRQCFVPCVRKCACTRERVKSAERRCNLSAAVVELCKIEFDRSSAAVRYGGHSYPVFRNKAAQRSNQGRGELLNECSNVAYICRRASLAGYTDRGRRIDHKDDVGAHFVTRRRGSCCGLRSGLGCRLAEVIFLHNCCCSALADSWGGDCLQSCSSFWSNKRQVSQVYTIASSNCPNRGRRQICVQICFGLKQRKCITSFVLGGTVGQDNNVKSFTSVPGAKQTGVDQVQPHAAQTCMDVGVSLHPVKLIIHDCFQPCSNGV